ncbi:hypothetical protein [Aquimarina muelleri]|uniref:Uncharacterized protein n=1 Tax=Aquimarina muelleri TaxID=279356 RepID=A0A918JVW5_9FLAO|nr:hypothetical protein [Aquimarina muelleri]MCX2764538.1 hypothetical protein [Aquimarina muelleri]GGX22923.1 hypothetical protein GCM10007384_25120 [Aquimarina muelleri]
MRRKKLPKNKHKGLFIYCSKCSKYFSWTKKTEKDKVLEPSCGESGNRFSTCKHTACQKYKVRLHLPGTIKGTTSKTLPALSYDEAVIQAIEFSNNFNKETFNVPNTRVEKRSSRIYLLNAQSNYVDHLADVGVPEHKKKNRSSTNIKTHIRSLKYFNKVLESKKIDVRLLPVDRIEDTHVGYFHQYLVREFGNRSYNRHMGHLKLFFNWIIEHHQPYLKNPFIVVRKPTTSNKETITSEEFYALLDRITPENGIYVSPTAKVRPRTNFYAPFLKDGFLLALHTGGRREEIVSLKWNMIREKNNSPVYIEVANLKVERIKKEEGQDTVAPKIIPVTQGLLEILIQMGYLDKKGSDDYILCPDRTSYKTQTLMEKLSKGFSHYYKQLETDRNLQFKCLRKTYLTYLEQVAKGDTKLLSSHTSDQVLQKHYIDERVVSKAIQEVRIFG